MTPTTIIALCEIMSKKDVSDVTGVSIDRVKRLTSGTTAFILDPDCLDRDFIESLGLKVCGCCDVRLVPKEPVDYQILTRLCVHCWKGESGSIDVYDLERVDSYNIGEIL